MDSSEASETVFSVAIPKLLIVEDHLIVREGLVRLMATELPALVYEAGTTKEADEQLALHPDIDLVLLDLALPGAGGISWLESIRKRFSDLPMMIITAFDDSQTQERVRAQGASGFASKSDSAEVLLGKVRTVLEGGLAFSDVKTHRPQIVSPIEPVPLDEIGLTPRQIQVLRLMQEGKSNREISEVLQISEGTTKIHVSAAFRILGVTTRTQALSRMAHSSKPASVRRKRS